MQENFDHISKLWAIKTIVDAANNKYTELCSNNACVSGSEVLAVMRLVADATAKVLHMRWTNTDGLYHGVRIYKQAIKNI